jgi:hypothetical protein
LQAYEQDITMIGASDVEWHTWSNCKICESVNFCKLYGHQEDLFLNC